MLHHRKFKLQLIHLLVVILWFVLYKLSGRVVQVAVRKNDELTITCRYEGSEVQEKKNELTIIYERTAKSKS